MFIIISQIAYDLQPQKSDPCGDHDSENIAIAVSIAMSISYCG